MSRNRFQARLCGIVAVAGFAASASAQSSATFIITSSSGSIGPPSPTTIIELWATWDDPGAAFVFGGANYDLIASDSTFLSGINILNGPGSSVGVIAANTVTGASNGQLHIPALNFFGKTDNPILLASYEWTTTDFTTRLVTFETINTNNFIVADEATGATTQLFPNAFSPGVAQIPIWPTPSTLAVLGLGACVAARRRRPSSR